MLPFADFFPTARICQLIVTPSARTPKRILLSVPHLGGTEINYVQEAFDTNWLSTVGPNLTALEREFSAWAGLPSVALASGTAGLHLGIKLLGVKPDDEVVSPTLTFIASCNPILYERAIPVLMDSERATWNLDPQLLADFLKKRADVNRLPKAVIVVHLFGQCADLDSILGTCRRYELPLLEDAAEALGATYKDRMAGTSAEVGIYSFNGNKIITCTGGGMLVSPRQERVDKVRYWSTQARDPGLNYLHSEVGYNYRLSNVLAGIALGQLKVLDERVAQRRAVFEHYRVALADIPGIEPQPEAHFDVERPASSVESLSENAPSLELSSTLDSRPSTSPHQRSTPNPQLPTSSSRHTRWLSCFLINETEFGMPATDLIRFLDAANIEARPVWKPMHTQKLCKGLECIGGKVAEDLNRRGICLPSSSSLSLEDQQFVIDRVREAHFAAHGHASRIR